MGRFATRQQTNELRSDGGFPEGISNPISGADQSILDGSVAGRRARSDTHPMIQSLIADENRPPTGVVASVSASLLAKSSAPRINSSMQP